MAAKIKDLKVSIVTAVRNGASSIRHTLDSVGRQSYPRIEHIVVDGASTDDTVEIVRNSGARVARMLSEPDTGVYDAFNKGLHLCTGDVVAYLNAGDEYADSEVIQTVVDTFSSSGADAVFGDLLIVDSDERTKVVRRYRSSQFKPSRARYGFMPAHPTLFIRRSVYEKCGGYDSSYEIAGDFELTTRLFVRNRISYSYVPKVLVRMPNGGLSTNGLRATWIITREMRRACESNALSTSWVRLILRFPIKLADIRFHPI